MKESLSILTKAASSKIRVAELHPLVMGFLKQAKAEGDMDRLARDFIHGLGIGQFLPAPYAKFQPVVLDSLVFIMQELPLSRLAGKIIDQIRLPQGASAGSRLTVLVSDMPTLQKLGQVICRSPGLDPVFRDALINLEDNLQTVTYGRIVRSLEKQVRMVAPHGRIEPEKTILSEATVCAVIPAKVKRTEKAKAVSAVLKIVKPVVRRHIKTDISLWDKLAVFLDENKDRWGMRDFNFSGAFNQVRWLIHNEVDLIAEQQNLADAAEYYQFDQQLVVPEVLPVATPQMTVMAREDGNKVTDVGMLTDSQRRSLARLLSRTCILRPIQDLDEISIFHGDPHAGNIAYRFHGEEACLIFYDWAMMGRLTRMDRFLLSLVAFGLILKNARVIYLACDFITDGQISGNPAIQRAAVDFIERQLRCMQNGPKGFFSEIKILFEELTYLGVTFPVQMMMFEKSVFTLKGVIADIDPDFDQNDYLAWEAMVQSVKDLVAMRFHRVLLEEVWSFFLNHPEGVLAAQKEILGSLFRIGINGLQNTFSQIRIL